MTLINFCDAVCREVLATSAFHVSPSFDSVCKVSQVVIHMELIDTVQNCAQNSRIAGIYVYRYSKKF